MAQLPTSKTSTRRAPKRAVLYLRVSSEGQVATDYNADGLSLLSQRQEGQAQAAKLGAKVLHEYSDPGRSAYVDLHKRTGFLEMLDEIQRCGKDPLNRIDYVIVRSVNRFARDTIDHWQARETMRAAGTRLISITEPIVGEDSPAAFLYESSIVSQSQYFSMHSGEQVRRGLRTKASLGGTTGCARLGYLNVRERSGSGRGIASVELDPQRHHFMTHAFQLYDSGEYSTSQLVEELYRLGLRSRPSKRRPPGKVGLSVILRALRDPYYAGWIVYKRGTPDEQIFPSRHEPLIDQDTFDRVQARLTEQRVSGERPQHRQQYLRGSVFCGECGRRLIYSVSTGKNGGKYPYYFCLSRVSGDRRPCGMRTNIRVHLIEEAVARHYRERPIQLSRQDIANRTAAIEALAGVSQQAVVQVREAKTSLIAKLKDQQQRLVRLQLEEDEDVAADAFRDERARMQGEIVAAEESLAETETRLQIDADQLRMALELAEDIARVYETADDATKRSFNQAFFQKLYVLPEWDEDPDSRSAHIAGAELTEPYALLLAEDLVPSALAEAEALRTGARNAEDDSYEPSSVGCSNYEHMVHHTGLEPVPTD